MIRGPLILTWPCSFRSILLQRESITFSDKCAGLHGARHVREWFEETLRSRDGSLSSTENTPCSERISYFRSDCQQLREASFQNLSPRASDACNLSQKPQTLSTNFHCFTTFDPHRGPVDLCHKTQRNHRRFSGWFSLSEPSSHNRQRYRPSFVQSRAAHVAAPRVADAWRDCLTLENENRCRRSLKPNLRLYDTDTRQKGDGQGRATNPGKCASVLVSLCCVAGEPAVLFTLRSSTLKGRHKGDVRSVGAGTRQNVDKTSNACIHVVHFLCMCSFAGGKSDPSDKDVVATALREAREELGVTVATEKVWGVLKPLRDMVSGRFLFLSVTCL